MDWWLDQTIFLSSSETLALPAMFIRKQEPLLANGEIWFIFTHRFLTILCCNYKIPVYQLHIYQIEWGASYYCSFSHNYQDNNWFTFAEAHRSLGDSEIITFPKKGWNDNIPEYHFWNLFQVSCFCSSISFCSFPELRVASEHLQFGINKQSDGGNQPLRALWWSAFTGSWGPAASLNWKKKTSCHNNNLPAWRGRETDISSWWWLECSRDMLAEHHCENMWCWMIPGVLTASFIGSELFNDAL